MSGLGPIERRKRIAPPAGLGHDGDVGLELEDRAQPAADDRVIIDQQHPGRSGRGSGDANRSSERHLDSQLHASPAPALEPGGAAELAHPLRDPGQPEVIAVRRSR